MIKVSYYEKVTLLCTRYKEVCESVTTGQTDRRTDKVIQHFITFHKKINLRYAEQYTIVKRNRFLALTKI